MESIHNGHFAIVLLTTAAHAIIATNTEIISIIMPSIIFPTRGIFNFSDQYSYNTVVFTNLLLPPSFLLDPYCVLFCGDLSTVGILWDNISLDIGVTIQ